jgi:hypothetical protein
LGGGGSSKNRKLVNCIICDNIYSSSGAGIYNNGVNLRLVHCTVTNNESSASGKGIYNSSGEVSLINSIVWNPNGTATQEIYNISAGTVSVVGSLVRNGEFGGGNGNPMLDASGFITKQSAAIGIGVLNGGMPYARADIFNIMRNSVRSDAGANEWKDSNGNGYPDWFERINFNSEFPELGDSPPFDLSDCTELPSGNNGIVITLFVPANAVKL